MGSTGGEDYPALLGKTVEQQIDEQEMTQIIGSESLFVPWNCPPALQAMACSESIWPLFSMALQLAAAVRTDASDERSSSRLVTLIP